MASADVAARARRAAAWAGRLPGETASDVRALLWIAANAPHIAARLWVIREMATGGAVVRVPETDPLIVTVIQPDGDVQTMVRSGLVQALSAEERTALIARHRTAMAARLPPLPATAGERLAATFRLTRRVAWGAPVATGTLTAAVSGGAVSELLAAAPGCAWSLAPAALAYLGRAALRSWLRGGVVELRRWTRFRDPR